MHRWQSSRKIFLMTYEKQSPPHRNAIYPGHFVICCVAALLHTSILCYCFIFAPKMELLFSFMGLNLLAHMRPEISAAYRFISELFRQSSTAQWEEKYWRRRWFEACWFFYSALSVSQLMWWGSWNRVCTAELTDWARSVWWRLCLGKMISQRGRCTEFVHNDEEISKTLGVETSGNGFEMKSREHRAEAFRSHKHLSQHGHPRISNSSMEATFKKK